MSFWKTPSRGRDEVRKQVKNREVSQALILSSTLVLSYYKVLTHLEVLLVANLHKTSFEEKEMNLHGLLLV